APWLAPYPPQEQHVAQAFRAPGVGHLLGTDELGRDVLSRIIYGGRISFTVGLVTVGFACTVGTSVGLISGWVGGFLDQLLMRLADVFLAFPQLILAMAVAAVLRPGLVSTIVAVATTAWPVYARLVRSVMLSIREREFVEAARAVGESSLRVLWKHALPNSLAPIIVRATLDVGMFILVAANLSFLGFGIQPPAAEWGAMVSGGRNYILNAWWVATFPGLAILLTVLACNLLGDVLRDSLDPRLKRL
ncbi:MAG TPA: ABC transporter permease, partial [Firmicutes bacterium]|nr:ABC transporter permease [Bacillota bacterium]